MDRPSRPVRPPAFDDMHAVAAAVTGALAGVIASLRSGHGWAVAIPLGLGIATLLVIGLYLVAGVLARVSRRLQRRSSPPPDLPANEISPVVSPAPARERDDVDRDRAA